MSYAEFAVTSNFSFLQGASHPEELIVQAAQLGLSGLGLCDRGKGKGSGEEGSECDAIHGVLGL